MYNIKLFIKYIKAASEFRAAFIYLITILHKLKLAISLYLNFLLKDYQIYLISSLL
ncbi:MAG: hypothetical protein K0R06_2902 [Clostridium sp.]|jgi:hypothetical protein|nr:hypothetical protein [Clostridium sp.]